MMTSTRIARSIRTEKGAIVRTEVFGEWIVDPSEVPHSPKFKSILKSLAYARAEEPSAGWKLETRGTESGWHEWKAPVSETSSLDIARAIIRAMGAPEKINRTIPIEGCYDADKEYRV